MAAQLLSALPVGAKVKDPNTKYNGKPIIFIVAAKNHSGYPSGAITLLTEKIISLKAFDAREASNTNTGRKSEGNNRYVHSNIRQWLNKDSNPWYVAQHSADAPPSSANVWVNHNPYNTEAGFLAGFSQQFRDVLLATSLTVAKNTVTDGGGSEVVSDKVFLLSNTEVGLENENNVKEGARLALFSAGTDASRIAYPTAEAITVSTYTNLNASSPWYYWLRTPFAGHSTNTCNVRNSGDSGTTYAYDSSRGVRPALNLPSSITVSDTVDTDGAYMIQLNQAPTITLDEAGGRTLYENDILNLAGRSTDGDVGDIVTIKYNIDNGITRNLNVGISDGSTPITYAKLLKLQNGKLFDGATVVTGELAEGVAHTLQVWAEDDKGAKSEVLTRLFYTVLNRAPIAQIIGFTTKQGLTEADTVNFNVNVVDEDGNNVTVKYVLNGGLAVQVYQGASGAFAFSIPVTTFADGINILTLQAMDFYNFQSTKTYQLDRSFIGSELAEGVARYNLDPGIVAVSGVIAWIEHQTGGTITAELSNVDVEAVENFVEMEKSNIVELVGDVTESEFSHYTTEAHSKVAMKLKFDNPIVQISGAFQE